MIPALNVDKLRLDLGDYVLSVQGMRKWLGGRYALDRVDLDVKRGSFTALVGPARAGKSLTLACIAGATAPTRGRVRYFGYEIRGSGQERIARIGIVRTHQTPRAFGDLCVRDSVTIGALLRRARLKRAQAYAEEMLDLTGLTGRDAMLFAQLDELDRTRLELARALATEPQVLLVDDVTAGLEPAATVAIGDVLTAIRARGVTIVAAARTLAAIPLVADDVVAIDSGRTAGVGGPAAANF